ncbi:MAG TPA: hypothetical protein VHM67_12820 [Gemmatimonadaceae bacterium]|nr:hypothetical protein [Gemmatimonadaceae bacterium]
MQTTTDTVVRTTATASDGIGHTVLASLTGAFAMLFAAIPRILAFIIVVLIGWLVASLLAKGIRAALRAARVNEAADRAGVGRFFAQMGTDAASAIAGVVKWLVRIVVLLVAFDLLGLPAVSDVLRQFLLWLPNLIVALVILFIAGLAANALAGIVRGATTEAGFANPDTLATVARVAVWTFAVVIAVNQLGIATNLINTLLTGVVAMLAIAGGLAFGLGGRDLAAETLESWRERGREARGKAERAVDAARRDTTRG